MSKKHTTLIGTALVAAIALTVPATSALAKGGPGMMGGMGGAATLEFEHFDQNGDGSLTKEEMRDIAAARFAKTDANGDGELSAEELQSAADARRDARFTRLIERFDADGNGTVSAEELDAAKGKMGEDRKQMRDHGGKGDRKAERGDRDGRDMKRDGDHRGMKRDGDHRGMKRGGDERREARGAQMFDRMFTLVDADGDGTVTKEEFDSAKSRLAAVRGGNAPEAPEAPAEN